MNRVLVTVFAALALAAAPAQWAAGAEQGEAYMVKVENAAAKVGEPTAVVARVTTQNGFKFSKSYRNRIIELSALDDAVTFKKRVVRGAYRDGAMVFEVGVTPVKAGSHPINGVFRIGFHDGEQLNMISVPMTATVTGQE